MRQLLTPWVLEHILPERTNIVPHLWALGLIAAVAIGGGLLLTLSIAGLLVVLGSNLMQQDFSQSQAILIIVSAMAAIGIIGLLLARHLLTTRIEKWQAPIKKSAPHLSSLIEDVVSGFMEGLFDRDDGPFHHQRRRHSSRDDFLN